LTPESELARERTRAKIFTTLSKKETSWSELLEETQISKSTLSKALTQLKDEGIVIEHVTRSRDSRRPTVLFSLHEKAKEGASRLLEVLSEFKKFEEMAEEYTELKKKEAQLKKKSLDRISKEYYEFVSDLSILIFEKALLADFKEPSRNSLVGLDALSSARKVLWENTFLKSSSESIKVDMNGDSIRIYSKCLKKIRELRKALSTWDEIARSKRTVSTTKG